MHNEEVTCMEILPGTDNTNNSNKLLSSPDVLDVPSPKRITRCHARVCSLPFIQCSIMDI